MERTERDRTEEVRSASARGRAGVRGEEAGSYHPWGEATRPVSARFRGGMRSPVLRPSEQSLAQEGKTGGALTTAHQLSG
jgi:hypothetical protein